MYMQKSPIHKKIFNLKHLWFQAFHVKDIQSENTMIKWGLFQVTFNIWKPINVPHHINKLKKSYQLSKQTPQNSAAVLLGIYYRKQT